MKCNYLRKNPVEEGSELIPAIISFRKEQLKLNGKMLAIKRNFLRLMPVLILSSLLLAACGGDDSFKVATSTPQAGLATLPSGKIGPTIGANGQITVVAPPASGGNLAGLFVWVNQNNIWLGGANSQAAPLTSDSLGGKALTKVPPLAQAISPALSPDNSQVAYGYSPEPEGTPGNIVIGQDIWVYDLKTNQSKLLIKRDEPQTFLDEPSWSADGKFLYFSYRTPTRDAKGVVTGEKIGIDRFEVISGNRERLAEDARLPAPMPDGKNVVYVSTDASGGTYDTELKMFDLATKKSKTLLGKNSTFLGFYAPRPSPNGDLIVFSGVGGPDTVLPDPNAPTSGQNIGPAPAPTKSSSLQNTFVNALLQGAGADLITGRPTLLVNQNVAAHGLPFDLWLIKPDGSETRRLTTLFEDQPVPSWSKNGKQVVFVAGLGLYTIDIDGKNLVKKSNRGAHGGFDWRE